MREKDRDQQVRFKKLENDYKVAMEKLDFYNQISKELDNKVIEIADKN